MLLRNTRPEVQSSELPNDLPTFHKPSQMEPISRSQNPDHFWGCHHLPFNLSFPGNREGCSDFDALYEEGRKKRKINWDSSQKENFKQKKISVNHLEKFYVSLEIKLLFGRTLPYDPFHPPALKPLVQLHSSCRQHFFSSPKIYRFPTCNWYPFHLQMSD